MTNKLPIYYALIISLHQSVENRIFCTYTFQNNVHILQLWVISIYLQQSCNANIFIYIYIIVDLSWNYFSFLPNRCIDDRKQTILSIIGLFPGFCIVNFQKKQKFKTNIGVKRELIIIFFFWYNLLIYGEFKTIHVYLAAYQFDIFEIND